MVFAGKGDTSSSAGSYAHRGCGRSPAFQRVVTGNGSAEDRRRRLQVFQLDAGGRDDHVPGDVDRVLLTGVQGADLVFVHHQRVTVSGMRFTLQ